MVRSSTGSGLQKMKTQFFRIAFSVSYVQENPLILGWMHV